MNSEREWLSALTLNLVDTKNFSPRKALDKILGEITPENQNLRATINALILETLRRKNIIDRLANKALDDSFKSKQSPYPSLKRLDSKVKNLLRIVIYRIKFENHAFELVSNTSKIILESEKPHFVEYFDLWLNNIHTIDVNDFIETMEDPIDQLALKTWQPYFLVKRFSEVFHEKAAEIFEYFKGNSPVFIRFNNLKEKKIVLEELEKYNVVLEPDPLMKDVFKVTKSDVPIARLQGFKKGYFYIQSRSSALISYFLNPNENETILDSCASPGSKTTHIASLTHDKCKITALEVDNKRVQILKNTLKRCGVTSVTVLSGDATNPPLKEDTVFDKILIDAPCSGSGTLSSKTYAKWRIKNSLIKQYSQLQIEILSHISKYLKKDGLLLYSTCSLLPEENEEIISKFLMNNPNFVSQELLLPEIGFEIDFKGKRLLPTEVDSEGFTIFLLKRIK